MNDPADMLLAASLAYLRGLRSPVVDDFVAMCGGDMRRRDTIPSTLPVLRHLDRTVQIAPPPEGPLVRLLAEVRAGLFWGQTYTARDFGPAFLDEYGWTEVFGTRGPFAGDGVAGGFLLLGPQTVYPDHYHVAEEVYVPLTSGALWRKGTGDFVDRPAGQVIHHPSQVTHAMRTGSEPLLALYLWRGGDLAQKSTIVQESNQETGANG